MAFAGEAKAFIAVAAVQRSKSEKDDDEFLSIGRREDDLWTLLTVVWTQKRARFGLHEIDPEDF